MEVVPRPQLGVDDGRWHLRCRSFGLEVLVVVDDMRSSCELQQQQPRPSKTHYKCSHCPHSHTDQVARTGEGCNKVEDGGCYLYCAAAGRTADRLLLLVSQGDILCLKNTINLWIFYWRRINLWVDSDQPCLKLYISIFRLKYISFFLSLR